MEAQICRRNRVIADKRKDQSHHPKVLYARQREQEVLEIMIETLHREGGTVKVRHLLLNHPGGISRPQQLKEIHKVLQSEEAKKRGVRYNGSGGYRINTPYQASAQRPVVEPVSQPRTKTRRMIEKEQRLGEVLERMIAVLMYYNGQYVAITELMKHHPGEVGSTTQNVDIHFVLRSNEARQMGVEERIQYGYRITL